jgi:hypothetical protein
MLKTLALSASALAFSGGLAFAETSSLSTSNWLASDVYKADVYDPSEHKIGKVTDLMIDSNGNVTAAIIGVGWPERRRDSLQGAASLDARWQGLAGSLSHQR